MLAIEATVFFSAGRNFDAAPAVADDPLPRYAVVSGAVTIPPDHSDPEYLEVAGAASVVVTGAFRPAG